MVGVKGVSVVVGGCGFCALNESEVWEFFRADEESMSYLPGAGVRCVSSAGVVARCGSKAIFRPGAPGLAGPGQRGKLNWQKQQTCASGCTHSEHFGHRFLPP